jgi:hypothetical protein
VKYVINDQVVLSRAPEGPLAIHVGASPVADRIKVVDGDFFKGPIPDGHDAVILANVIHLFESQPNIELLRRLRSQVQIGARLLIVDFWTDPTHTQPVLAALMAGEFLIQAGQGTFASPIFFAVALLCISVTLMWASQGHVH